MARGNVIKRPCPCHRVGTGSKHHFFGYYNKSNWDPTDRYLLANQVPTMDADIMPSSVCEVGFFDLEDQQTYFSVGRTAAWNWQMGCQLQWLDGESQRQLIYNIRTDESRLTYPGFASRIYNASTGQTRDLPLPIYVVAPNSSYALCVDYSRLHITHETIGYVPSAGPQAMPNAPAHDGIHYMDLSTAASRLLLSYRDLREFNPVRSMDKAIHWVSHIEINPSSERILFLHRWTERVEDETCFLHRLITVNPDGTDVRLLECSDHPLPQLSNDFDPQAVGTFDYEKSEYQISHPLWQDGSHIIVWGPHGGEIHYHLYTDRDDGEVQVVGRDILTENGHMTFSPIDKRWLLSDTYPDSGSLQRILFLFDVERGIRYDIGSFYTPDLRKENRCDLHPRWSRDGQLVCIDSVHEGMRQMYILDVSGIVSRGALRSA